MVSKSKQRTEQHIIDSKAQDLLRSIIPRHWVLRDYRPDYGIDYDVEVFKNTKNSERVEINQAFETLGEHFFIQLKGFKKIARQTIKLYGRKNVEKSTLKEDKTDLVAEMEVIPYSLEMPELVTVQRMGAALPVLLVLADLETQNCYFVCLNDYIDKILVPKHKDYTSKNSRVIHVPTKNVLADPLIGLVAMRWYAKRAKLYAAFQKFVYQEVELQYAFKYADFLELANHFTSLLIQYDFWQDTEMWTSIPYHWRALENFATVGNPKMLNIIDESKLAKITDGNLEALNEIKEKFQRRHIMELWRCLAILPQNYEEICREWFLPTPLGFITS